MLPERLGFCISYFFATQTSWPYFGSFIPISTLQVTRSYSCWGYAWWACIFKATFRLMACIRGLFPSKKSLPHPSWKIIPNKNPSDPKALNSHNIFVEVCFFSKFSVGFKSWSSWKLTWPIRTPPLKPTPLAPYTPGVVVFGAAYCGPCKVRPKKDTEIWTHQNRNFGGNIKNNKNHAKYLKKSWRPSVWLCLVFVCFQLESLLEFAMNTNLRFQASDTRRCSCHC